MTDLFLQKFGTITRSVSFEATACKFLKSTLLDYSVESCFTVKSFDKGKKPLDLPVDEVSFLPFRPCRALFERV